MLTLTWNYPNQLGFPNGQAGGLTETGVQFLEEMEALGMIPDVSHLSDDGFWDLCRAAGNPLWPATPAAGPCGTTGGTSPTPCSGPG